MPCENCKNRDELYRRREQQLLTRLEKLVLESRERGRWKNCVTEPPEDNFGVTYNVRQDGDMERRPTTGYSAGGRWTFIGRKPVGTIESWYYNEISRYP